MCADVLQAYLRQPDTQSIHYDAKDGCFHFKERGVAFKTGGIHTYLQRTFYPHITTSSRQRRRGGGSSREIGSRIDAELVRLCGSPKDCAVHCQGSCPAPLAGTGVATGKGYHRFTIALVEHLHGLGHRLVKAQVPVRIRRIARVTQADLITADSQGRLWMFEVKSGGSPMLNRGNGVLQGPLKQRGIPCSMAAQWDLQRQYTHQALVAEGIPIYASRVIRVRTRRTRDPSPRGSSETRGAQAPEVTILEPLDLMPCH